MKEVPTSNRTVQLPNRMDCHQYLELLRNDLPILLKDVCRSQGFFNQVQEMDRMGWTRDLAYTVPGSKSSGLLFLGAFRNQVCHTKLQYIDVLY